jgi:hypothetical protein
MRTSAGGTVSFKKKGRIEAVLVRVETTNAVLWTRHGEYLTIAACNLSDVDRSYLAKASAANEADPAWNGQPDVVRNEMSRRRREAAKLREDAALKRSQAQTELEAADKLESEAAKLSGKASEFESQAQAQHSSGEKTNNLAEVSVGNGTNTAKDFGKGSIAASAAAQLAQDSAGMRSLAQEKRNKAAALQKEADNLERLAEADLAPIGLR